jgi:NDP-sugar pyrophosphorylase family protein
MKAMVLAAGLGTRLRPLTLERCKPAMPLLEKPIIAGLLERLMQSGITDFRINLHHLPGSVERIFESPPWNTYPVSFSHEECILGTAGGLKANESFFRDETFLMVNGKIVAGFSLQDALAFHRESGALATLVLYPQVAPFRWFPVRIDHEGRLQNFKGAPVLAPPRPEAYVFTGIHILEPEIFSFIPPGVFYEINDQVYPQAMAKGLPVFGFPVDGYWYEPSNPFRYLEAQRQLFKRDHSRPFTCISHQAHVARTASLGPFVSLGSGCVVDDRAKIENSILWENVHVQSGASVKNCVIGAGVHIQGQCEDKVVTLNGEVSIAAE